MSSTANAHADADVQRGADARAPASARCCFATAAGCRFPFCSSRCSRRRIPRRTNWIAGAVLIVIGEWIRLAGVSAAGTVTRRRSRDVQRLVTYGIFRWVRNPLYVGNFFIWMGFVVISGVHVVPADRDRDLRDRVLADRRVRGGRARVDLRRGVSRLQARRRRAGFRGRRRSPRAGPHDWGEAWRSEISTFLQYAALAVVFGLKQKYM